MLYKYPHPSPNRINDVHVRRWDGSKFKCTYYKSMLRSQWVAMGEFYGGICWAEADNKALDVSWHYPEECDIPDRRIHLRRIP